MSDVPGVKVCTRCGGQFPATVEWFTPSKENRAGLRPECRSCRKHQKHVKRREPAETGQKVCSQCGVERPVTDFFVKTSGRDGRAAACKKCQRESNRRNAARERDDKPDSRVCYRCEEEHPFTEEWFYRNRANPFGLEYECKACSRQRERKWAENNPDKVLERARRWKRNNREKARREAYEWREQNKDYQREYIGSWKKRNPDRVRLYSQATKARRRAAEGSYSISDVLAQYESQEGQCFYCKESVPMNEAHVDHYIPLARGGTNDPSNIVISCARCNFSKGAKMPEDFIASLE